MRVELNSVEEFCEELDQDHEAIHRALVRVRIDRVPEQDEEISFAVRVWCTALVRTPEGDYVLEYGGVAGRDEPQDPDGGTREAERWRDLVRDTAARHDLRVRSGKIEIW